VHAPTEDKDGNIKGSCYEELERVFGQFPEYLLAYSMVQDTLKS